MEQVCSCLRMFFFCSPRLWIFDDRCSLLTIRGTIWPRSLGKGTSGTKNLVAAMGSTAVDLFLDFNHPKYQIQSSSIFMSMLAGLLKQRGFLDATIFWKTDMQYGRLLYIFSISTLLSLPMSGYIQSTCQKRTVHVNAYPFQDVTPGLDDQWVICYIHTKSYNANTLGSHPRVLEQKCNGTPLI